MKLSARNTFKGKVTEIKEGVVNCEVLIDVGGTIVTSIITKDAVNSLSLAEGGVAYAVIKASNVMVMVD